MKSDFEYMNQPDNERLAMLETRAAEMERMLGSVAPERGVPRATLGHGYRAHAEYADDGEDPAPAEYPGSHDYPAPPEYPAPGDYAEGFEAPADEAEPDGRTEVLITRGRRNVRPSRLGFARAHWRILTAVAAALTLLAVILSVVSSGGSPSWPARVTAMKTEITAACENPNVAAEPSQLNFACAKGTQGILWVFALLTSGGNPGYVDPTTGRKGLEPITPAQGGDVAWSLNLHQPYDPSNAVDSIEVAARAINNIIGGATLTSASGTPSVQAGLESSAANCQRYTGSSALRTRSGYPAACAGQVTSASGQAALVSDVFRDWMVGAPAQLASDAGVLFVNSSNPGNPQVQQILNSLPGSGL
jgi:hypothetical protein